MHRYKLLRYHDWHGCTPITREFFEGFDVELLDVRTEGRFMVVEIRQDLMKQFDSINALYEDWSNYYMDNRYRFDFKTYKLMPADTDMIEFEPMKWTVLKADVEV